MPIINIVFFGGEAHAKARRTLHKKRKSRNKIDKSSGRETIKWINESENEKHRNERIIGKEEFEMVFVFVFWGWDREREREKSRTSASFLVMSVVLVSYGILRPHVVNSCHLHSYLALLVLDCLYVTLVVQNGSLAVSWLSANAFYPMDDVVMVVLKMGQVSSMDAFPLVKLI